MMRVDAYRAGPRTRARHSKLDVGKARGKDPEVPVDGRAIEDLDRQLDIARREEPDVARVVCCRDDLTEANLIGAVLPLQPDEEATVQAERGRCRRAGRRRGRPRGGRAPAGPPRAGGGRGPGRPPPPPRAAPRPHRGPPP